MADQLENFKRELRRISDEFDRLNESIVKGADPKKIKSKYDDLMDQYDQITQQIEKSTSKSDQTIVKLRKGIEETQTGIEALAGSQVALNKKFEGDQTIPNYFGGIGKGLSATGDKFRDLNSAFHEFVGTMNVLNPEANLAFWREYHKRIRDVGVEYGLSSTRLQEFKDSNLEVERTFVETGQDIRHFTQSIDSLFETTQQVNQITPEMAKNLGNAMKVMNLSAAEAGSLYGGFKNLNVSFNTTTKLLEDLRYSAEKSALNTNAVLKTFGKNFEELSRFSFRNGVNGMMDLVKNSAALKVNMDKVLELSDKLIDPEQTMEFASNMQMLGGSFSQLGDFNQLMYDAAVAPEDLAKNIAKATASLGSFDRATGAFTLSFADRLQLKEASKFLNITEKDLNKMTATAAKVKDIKMMINVPELTEDQMNVLGSMAEFDTGRGEYTVKVGGETKSIAELSKEDIEKLSASEKQTFEELRTERMDVGDVIATNLILSQYSTLDLFKVIGGDSDKFKGELGKLMSSLVDGLHEAKKGIGVPIESFFNEVFNTLGTEALKQTQDALSLLGIKIGEFTDLIKDSSEEVGKGITDFKKSIGIIPLQEPQSTSSINPPKEKQEYGGILKGPSHSEGGIPFTVDGKSGFEAEGGEVLLTKGVSKDPQLLSLVSKINEFAGGKKLFAEGDVLTTNKTSDGKISITNNVDTTPMAKSIIEQSAMFDYHLEEMSKMMGVNIEEIGKMVNNFSVPNFSEQKIIPSIDSDYISSKIGDLISVKMFSEYNKLKDDFENITKEINLNFADLLKLNEENSSSIIESLRSVTEQTKDKEIIIEKPTYGDTKNEIGDTFKELNETVKKLNESINGKEFTNKDFSTIDNRTINQIVIDNLNKGKEEFFTQSLKESERTKEKGRVVETPINIDDINNKLKEVSESVKNFNDRLKEKDTIIEKPTSGVVKNEIPDYYREVGDLIKNFSDKVKEIEYTKPSGAPIEQLITNTPINNQSNVNTNYSNLEQLSVNQLNVNESKNIKETSNINSSESIQNSYTQTFEKIQNEINNLSKTYLPSKERVSTNIMEVGQVSPIKELPKITNEKVQGQLPTRMLEIPSEVKVGGNVTGNIEVKIPSFEVTLRGMGPNMTETMEMPEHIKKEIYAKINEGISNMSMYNLSITKQGGINDGKPSNPLFFPVSPNPD